MTKNAEAAQITSLPVIGGGDRRAVATLAAWTVIAAAVVYKVFRWDERG